MKRILSTILLAATLLCTLWISPLVHAQTEKLPQPQAEEDTDANTDNAQQDDTLIKIAQPERTVATFGNGSSAMALLDGKTDSGYQIVPLGKDCTVTLNLGNPYLVARVCVYTYNQSYTFRLLASMDGINYTPIGENEIGVSYSPKTGYVLDVAARECRFLKLEGLSGQFDYFSLYEIEVYAKKGEKNPLSEVSIPQSTSATLANGSGAGTLIDGSCSGSYQMLPIGDNCYATLDLGQPYAVRRVSVCTYNENYRFRIEGSLDGKTFLALGENSLNDHYDPQTGFSLAVLNGSFRYLRVIGLSGQYGFFSLYEIDVFADLTPVQPLPADRLYEVSLPDYASAKTASGTEIPLLLDGAIRGNYRMIPEGDDCYVTIALPDAYTVQKVTVYTYDSGYGFTLEGSLDGLHYTPLGANDTSSTYDPEKGYSISVTAGEYRFLRIMGTVCPYGFFSLYEIDVFATKAPPERGDINWDMLINVEDLNLLLTALSTGETLPYGDLDGNGILNVADLNDLLVILSTKE